MAMLENELKVKCKTDPKLIWPVFFKRFIDDGFGITKGVQEDVVYWIEKFNKLRKTVQIDKYNWGNAFEYMDLFIYKRTHFIWMVNFRSLFTKTRLLRLCTSLFVLSINDIPSRTLFGMN